MIPAAPTPCKGRPDLFTIPEGERPGSASYNARVSEAKRLCARCPELLACRDEARARSEEGVWGGEDDTERAAALGRRLKPVRVPRELAPCGTEQARRRHRRRQEACATCVYQPKSTPAATAAAA